MSRSALARIRFVLGLEGGEWPFLAMNEGDDPGSWGTHQFPGTVSAAAALSSASSAVSAQPLHTEEAMEAIPSSEVPPSGVAQSSAPQVHWDDDLVRDADGNILPSSTPPPGQIVNVEMSHNDDDDVVVGSSVSMSGGDVRYGNSQPHAGSQSGVPRDQPGGTGNVGHGLRGTQPAGSQGHTALADRPDNRNPLLNRGWQDVASRMAVITLPAAGRPYRRVQLEQALLDSDVDCDSTR